MPRYFLRVVHHQGVNGKRGSSAKNACLHGLQPRQNKRKGSVPGTSPTSQPGAAQDQEQSESHKRRPRDHEHGTGTGPGREREAATQGHSQAARTGRGPGHQGRNTSHL